MSWKINNHLCPAKKKTPHAAVSVIKIGDTVYPSVVAVFSMWIVSTLGCYLLAVPLGLGLPGIWIAFAADECLRGLLMQLRWKSGKWKNKSLYSRAKAS